MNQGQAEQRIPPGEVDFGSLRRLTPISRKWGYDRGGPVDRYYIEAFLRSRAAHIRGRVLEIGDNSYTRAFGGDRVVVSDVLHVVEGTPQATIIGDLVHAPQIASDTFDCIILTQTLQLVYDLRRAISTLHRILKPGGVLLATVPGISQTYDDNWGKDWCWGFTRNSFNRLLEDEFVQGNVAIDVFGNVLSATAFLHGLGAEELTAEELDYHDWAYAVTIAATAIKAS